MITIDKKRFKEHIVETLNLRGTNLKKATKRELFDAVSLAAMSIVTKNWMETQETYEEKEVQQA